MNILPEAAFHGVMLCAFPANLYAATFMGVPVSPHQLSLTLLLALTLTTASQDPSYSSWFTLH